MKLKTIQGQDFTGKKVVVRFDFNVPIDEAGTITDLAKIDAALPTLRFLIESSAASITLLSHLGQPTSVDPHFSLAPVAQYLRKVIGDGGQATIETTKGFQAFSITPSVRLLENVRFNPGEEENDPELAKRYAAFGAVFVFDAFGTAHREQASTIGIMSLLPSFAGLLVAKEVEHLERLRTNPRRPFIMIIGGAKIEDKLPIIESLQNHVDTFLVGGAVANTFLKARGVDVKQSLEDDAELSDAKRIAGELDTRLILPQDSVWDQDKIVDIGPKTAMEFEDRLTDANTILWNGNLGKTEEQRFSRGSLMIADFVSRLTDKTRIIAGGDTAGFVHAHHLAEKMTFVSTGGGATLDYLAGKELPALKALEDQL